MEWREGFALPALAEAALRGRRGRPYILDEATREAVEIAALLQRPLLVTGEPGTGKTDLAYALAGALSTPSGPPKRPHCCFTHSESELEDLLYHYDALRRYAALQTGNEAERGEAREPAPFVTLRGLGAALALGAAGSPEVVLIDEIDKAPRRLPNGLLEVIEDRTFTIRELPGRELPGREESGTGPARTEVQDRWVPIGREMPIRGAGDKPAIAPLIIFTSNDEQALPKPFLRRCFYHHLEFPGEAQLLHILERWDRGDGGSGDEGAGPYARELAVEAFSALRSHPGLAKKPSTSELIDWYTVVFKARPAGRAPVVDPKRPGALPALGCLLKHREDLEAVKRSG